MAAWVRRIVWYREYDDEGAGRRRDRRRETERDERDLAVWFLTTKTASSPRPPPHLGTAPEHPQYCTATWPPSLRLTLRRITPGLPITMSKLVQLATKPKRASPKAKVSSRALHAAPLRRPASRWSSGKAAHVVPCGATLAPSLDDPAH